MKNLLTILCAATLLIASMAPASAQGTGSDGFGVFVNTGFGWANNLRMTDWLNAMRDNSKLFLGGTNFTEDQEQNTLLYAGFDVEPRYFSGNIGYGLAFGYYNATNGSRNISGSVNKFHADADLTAIAIRPSVYYRIGLDNNNYLLLGGGFGYYRASLNVTYGFNDNLESYEGTGWTIGWHAGLEYNWKLGPVVVNLGVLSRFAEIWKLEINKANGDEVYDVGASFSGIYFYVGAGYMI
jgi:hypothetical protein